MNRNQLAHIRLNVPEHRAVLEGWFGEVEANEIPSLRVPWARPGWFDEAKAWIGAQCDRLGLLATGPIEQMRNWAISSVLRVNTTEGYVYFKAVPKWIANEPLVIRSLSERFYDNSPVALAIDANRRWMLVRDMKGGMLSKISDVARWDQAMRIFARIQIGYADDLESLFALGCPDRRLDKLSIQIDELMSDTAALMAGTNHGLSAPQVEELRELAPRLKGTCIELKSLGLPDSIEHGDFWAGNIAVAGSSMRSAYLEQWLDYASMDRLNRAFDLSQALGIVHSALTYYLFVLPNLEDKAKGEMENMVGFYLQLLLRNRSQLIDLKA